MGRKLKTLGKLIEKKLSAGNSLAIEIGELLIEVQEEHFSERGQGAEMLKWIAEEFGMKKAYAYRHMNIAKVFGTEERKEAFSDCSVNVLHTLTQDENMLAAAVEAIDEGETVNAEWVSAYKEANKPAKQAADDDDDKEEEEEETTSGSSSKSSGPMDDALVLELEKQIEAQQAELEALKAGAEETTNLDLPTFFAGLAAHMQEQTPEAVLCVAEGTKDKRAINKAKRDMAKLFDSSLVGEHSAPVLEIIQLAADTILGVSSKESTTVDKKEEAPAKAKGKGKSKDKAKSKKEKA